MAFLGATLVGGVLVDEVTRSETPGAPRERPFAVVRQQKRFGDAPVSGHRQVRHGLTQLGPVSRVLDEIQLVDDVHEIVQLGHAPENPVQSQLQLPEIVAPVAVHQQVGLADVPMRAP